MIGLPFEMASARQKIVYRNNKAVLPISVSDKQATRALTIMDTLIHLVNELDGSVIVESGEKDNGINSEKNQNIFRLINNWSHSIEELKELKELDSLELLTSESKTKFLDWCKNIRVPKRIAGLPLVALV